MLRSHRFRDFDAYKALSLVALMLVAITAQGGI